VATESFAYATDTAIEIKVRKSSFGTRYVPNDSTGTITATGFSSTVTMRTDIIATPEILNSTNFDGSADYFLRGGALTGVSDGKQGTISVWLDVGDSGTARTILDTNLALNRILFSRTLAGRLSLVARSPSATIVINVESATNLLSTDGWTHYLWSWDLANTTVLCYRNDVEDLDTAPLTIVDNDVDWTGPTEWGYGANTGGAAKWLGCLSEMWVDTTFIDITKEANRRKFILVSDQDNRVEPAFLGDSGQKPTGSAPIIYFPNAFGSHGTNAGTSGDFTEDAGSSVVACATTPIPI
jgi:hypothetical protein